MDHDGSDVIWVRFEGGNALGGVTGDTLVSMVRAPRSRQRSRRHDILVVYAELEVVAAADYPVLPRNEASSSYGDIGELEGLDDFWELVSRLDASWLPNDSTEE